MNSQERLEKVYCGELPDRVPILLLGLRPHWAAERFFTGGRIVDGTPVWPNDPGHDPSIERVLAYARGRVDMLVTWGPPPNVFWSAPSAVTFEKQSTACDVEGYDIIRTICHAPAGDLIHEEYVSSVGFPPYTGRRFIQNEDDLRIFLSIPDTVVPVDGKAFNTFRKSLPEDVCYLIMPGPAPAAMLYELIEPETFLIWSMERRSQLLEIVEMLAGRRLRLVRDMLAANIGPIYQTIGHEDFIPPMMRPHDLRDFVLSYDRKFCDLIHGKGGRVYCHCHGRVNAFLEDFAESGIDSLHPLEPAPMGNTDFADAKRRIGGRMVLFGNIQTHDLMTCPSGDIKAMVKKTVETGKSGGRFCLTPSAEVIVGPAISSQMQDNLIAFIDTGLEFGRY